MKLMIYMGDIINLCQTRTLMFVVRYSTTAQQGLGRRVRSSVCSATAAMGFMDDDDVWGRYEVPIIDAHYLTRLFYTVT